MPAVHDRSAVDRHKVTLAQGPRPRYAVDHLFVDADTEAAGKTVVAEKRGCRASAPDELLRGPVEITGRDAVARLAPDELQGLPHDNPGHPHLADLVSGLDVESLTTEHRRDRQLWRAERTAWMRSATSSISPIPST